MKVLASLTAAVLVGVLILLFAANELFVAIGEGERTGSSRPDHEPGVKLVDLRIRFDYQILPHYVDLYVGDTVRVIKSDGEPVDIRVAAIEAESRRYSCPRVRVDFDVEGRRYAAWCGMLECNSGGIGPINIDGVKLGVEITEHVFSKMKGGSSPLSNFRTFRLNGDVRLAIWEGSRRIMRGVEGLFPVDQPEWSRERYGNWIHSTSYGMHGGTDIYATRHGVPQRVLSPLKGTVFKVYNVNIEPDDSRRSKTVTIYGDAIVGPKGEKVFFRFLHLSQIFVSKGEQVEKGQVIGLTGHTGFKPTVGDHLHFEIRLNPSHFGAAYDDDYFATVPVNPYNFLLEWYENSRVRRAN